LQLVLQQQSLQQQRQEAERVHRLQQDVGDVLQVQQHVESPPQQQQQQLPPQQPSQQQQQSSQPSRVQQQEQSLPQLTHRQQPPHDQVPSQQAPQEASQQQQPLQPSQEDPMEQQRASLLLQTPLEPQGGRNNVAAPQQLQPPMLHEPAEAPTTASTLTQGQMELIAANREAALRRRQQQQPLVQEQQAQPQHQEQLQVQQQQVQPQQQEQLQVQQQQVQPQDAVAQQTQLEITTSHGGICGEQQQPSGGQQATAQSSGSGNINKCIICLEDLQIMQVQALPCMHCFHKICLEDWQRCTDKPAHHCPMKCHLNIQSLVAEDMPDEDEVQIGGDGGNEPQPPDPSAPVGAELSQLIEEALGQ
jgi:hypothetical protein